MVLATLAGRKSVTRRTPSCTNSLVDGKRISGKAWKALRLDFTRYDIGGDEYGSTWFIIWSGSEERCVDVAPIYNQGDQLWFKETWAEVVRFGTESDPMEPTSHFVYKADSREPYGLKNRGGWKSSMFMPKEAARLWALIPSPVICEHLHDITEEQARREGCTAAFENADPGTPWTALTAFECLWDKLHGPDSWPANGPVYVIPFEHILEPEMKDNTMGE